MLPGKTTATKKIAAVRIHVERKKQLIKCFCIIGRNIENKMNALSNLCMSANAY